MVHVGFALYLMVGKTRPMDRCKKVRRHTTARIVVLSIGAGGPQIASTTFARHE